MRIPEFTGEPLSVYSRMTQLDAPTHLYHYAYKQIPLPGDLDTINKLTEQGLQRITGKDDIERGIIIACLYSQLFDVVYVRDGAHFTPWAHHTSIEYVKKYPVCLAFKQDDPSPANQHIQDSEHIQMLQFLPLPRHGEFAVISIKESGVYTHHDLGEQGTALKIQMGNALIDLAGQSKWGTFSEVHSYCTSELNYMALLTSLRTDLLSARGKARKEAQEHIQKLEQAHNEVVALRQSWLRPDWLAVWSEVRRMAQELAKDYYEFHQNVHNESTYLFDQAEMKQIEKKKPRPYSPQTFDETGYAPIVSSLAIQTVINGINNAVSGANKWMFDEESGVAPYFPHQSKASSIIMSYTNRAETTIPDSTIAKRLWEEVKGFDEGASDVILDIFSHLSRNLGDDGAAWFFASKHLDNRNLAPITKPDGENKNGEKKRRRAGVRKEDVQPISETLWRLENIWLTIHQEIQDEGYTKPKKNKDGTLQKPKRKRTQYTHQGRFLTVDQRWYQNDLTDEEQITPFPTNSFAIGWHIRPGDWLRTFLEMPNRQVAQLCKTLLEYDPYRQKWEKRIGRYIMFHGYMQTKGRGGSLPRNIQVILDEVSLTPDPKKRDKNTYIRTREHFEKALTKLTEDKVIDGWKYKDSFVLSNAGRLEGWLEQDVLIYIAPSKELPETSGEPQTEANEQGK